MDIDGFYAWIGGAFQGSVSKTANGGNGEWCGTGLFSLLSLGERFGVRVVARPAILKKQTHHSARIPLRWCALKGDPS